MKDINLLQSFQNERKQFNLTRYKRRAMVFLAALALLLGAAAGGLWYGVSSYDRQTQRLREEAAQYAEVTQVKASISQLKAQAEALRTLLDTARAASPVDTGILDTLAGALGDEIYFTTLNITENGAVSISGSAATRKEIADLLYNLKETGAFTDVAVNLVNAEELSDGETALYDFTMTAVMKGEEAGE